jgi:hypothetical protein
MRSALLQTFGPPFARLAPPLPNALIAAGDLAKVRRIVSENGLRPLTVGELRQIREDALGRLGSSIYLGELALYAAIAGEVREGWVPPPVDVGCRCTRPERRPAPRRLVFAGRSSEGSSTTLRCPMGPTESEVDGSALIFSQSI